MGATIGEKKTQPGSFRTFLKVPNMNHRCVDARRVFPVLLGEPLESSSLGVKCFGWLYGAAR